MIITQSKWINQIIFISFVGLFYLDLKTFFRGLLGFSEKKHLQVGNPAN